MTSIKRALFFATLPLAFAAAPAQAQQELDPAQVESAVRFGLPALFEGYRATCAAELAPAGYVARNADRLAAKFAQGADAHWPEAKAALLTLGGDDGGMDPAMISGMPDEALKPFVVAFLQQMVATEIKPEQCTDIARGLELIDPLPADNIAGLIAFVVELGGRKGEAADDQAAADE